MDVSGRLALAKLPFRFLLGGNRVAAAAARRGTADALEQLTNRGEGAPQHPRILTRARLKVPHRLL